MSQNIQTSTTLSVWFTTAMAADFAACTAATIAKACRQRTLRASKPRGSSQWRIHRDDLNRWLRNGRV